MNPPNANRKYNEEEKRQLIANLDIEVAHRSRQFEAWLMDRLENFTIHQEGQVSRIPKQVRGMTMREFGEKYGGNVQLALRGFQKDKLTAAGADSSFGEIDKNMRKRKWVANHEVDLEEAGKDAGAQRATKNAKTGMSSPLKKVAGSSTGPGTAQRARLAAVPSKTPSLSRTMGRVPASPSPQKPRPPFNNTTVVYNPRPTSRPTSPLKYSTLKHQGTANLRDRVPSSSSFNPVLPEMNPLYPNTLSTDDQTAALRLPRKDEDMLSVNGSPLANPYQFGLGWFKGVELREIEFNEGDSEDSTQAIEVATRLKRSKSSIIVRRDPSVAFPSLGNLHSRTNSQASLFTTSSSQTASSTHSRENSQAVQPYPSSIQAPNTFRFPASRTPVPEATQTVPKHSRSFSAVVAIPTKDGHLLEFDPLQTSPGALDALEGITDSAKKQARMEMGRLVQAAVDKWKIS